MQVRSFWFLSVEVEGGYMGYSATRRHCMSKAAVTHTFRKLRTPSRCRECDSYVYFQGAECVEVCALLFMNNERSIHN